MGQYVKYQHHGHWVWVRTDLRGKHRAHSLCHECALEGRCAIIGVIHKLCELTGCTLPVWECPEFVLQVEP